MREAQRGIAPLIRGKVPHKELLNRLSGIAP